MKKKVGILSYSLTNHQTMLDLAKKLSKKNKINFFYASDLNINYNFKNVEFIKLYIKEKTEKNLSFTIVELEIRAYRSADSPINLTIASSLYIPYPQR